MASTLDSQSTMWTVSIFPDPLVSHGGGQYHHHHYRKHIGIHQEGLDNSRLVVTPSSAIVSASISLDALLVRTDQEKQRDFAEGGRGGRVALADFVARYIAETCDRTIELDGMTYVLEPLDRILIKSRRRRANTTVKYPPYVLERSDVWCCERELHVTLRIITQVSSNASNTEVMVLDDEKKSEDSHWEVASKSLLFQLANDVGCSNKLMEHVACVALQQKIRATISSSKAVAFVANDSILPRKSGTSDAPMASPPAIPFKAPADSTLASELTIEMGRLGKYLPTKELLVNESTSVHLRGLLVPAGVTLICGGGYHGKSTLLQTIAAGIYDKIPGDGREYCVAVPDAVTVRAEDGRYVNNCNISAFISNLPTPPGATKAVDTKHFSTRDSSGSTSQAANVSEAIEMGATAMLVDEDVSAANFMARDGRMRALVMDESITPLLYRVNGLYHSLGISSVVVVGGVGDWLDVPHNVILLDKYVVSDATKKAQSISYQFSHGHVQYAGRGVVHRLQWEKSGTPIPRRPSDTFSERYNRDVIVSIMDGGHALSLHQDYETTAAGAAAAESDSDLGSIQSVVDDGDDEEGCIEASRLEQLLDRKQLYGCGLCVIWILQVGSRDSSIGLPDLLKKLDSVLDQGGLMRVVEEINRDNNVSSVTTTAKWRNMVEEVGFAHRPRKYEVGQALTRMYGIQMEEIPVEEDHAEAAAKLEAELKRQKLLEIWNNRRNKSQE